MLFFLTAVIGVGNNFHWIAKPTGVIALGSVFSTTQVFPLMGSMINLPVINHYEHATFFTGLAVTIFEVLSILF